MKDFIEDFNKFKMMLRNGEPFALSRNNDGEMIIINNEFIDIRAKCNGEFIYNPKEAEHAIFRQRLIDSAQHKGDNYYVGIACRCCVGDQKHEALKALTGQDDEHLTWGNIFVNGNYMKYTSFIIPIFMQHDIVLVANWRANIDKLPFAKKIIQSFEIGTNAWMEDFRLVEHMKDYVEFHKTKNTIFLFAAGPFSNILIHELYKIEPNNTYLDIGSTLDDMMGLGQTRGYLAGAPTLNKICIW